MPEGSPGRQAFVVGHAYAMLNVSQNENYVKYYNPWGYDGVSTWNDGNYDDGILKVNATLSLIACSPIEHY